MAQTKYKLTKPSIYRAIVKQAMRVIGAYLLGTFGRPPAKQEWFKIYEPTCSSNHMLRTPERTADEGTKVVIINT